jgi:hypothetical protein
MGGTLARKDGGLTAWVGHAWGHWRKVAQLSNGPPLLRGARIGRTARAQADLFSGGLDGLLIWHRPSDQVHRTRIPPNASGVKRGVDRREQAAH